MSACGQPDRVDSDMIRSLLTSALVSNAKRNWLGWFRTVAKVRVQADPAMTKTQSSQTTSTEPAK